MPNEMAIMDRTGDTKVLWDTDNSDEVEAARAMFDKLKKKRYVAYSVKSDGEQNKIIHSFDKTLGKLIMVPPVVGG